MPILKPVKKTIKANVSILGLDTIRAITIPQRSIDIPSKDILLYFFVNLPPSHVAGKPISCTNKRLNPIWNADSPSSFEAKSEKNKIITVML